MIETTVKLWLHQYPEVDLPLAVQMLSWQALTASLKTVAAQIGLNADTHLIAPNKYFMQSQPKRFLLCHSANTTLTVL